MSGEQGPTPEEAQAYVDKVEAEHLQPPPQHQDFLDGVKMTIDEMTPQVDAVEKALRDD